MTPQDLIAAFDTLAEAPEGLKRLRELVLQLAVRGKLVPQDPEDEPASVLLERIAAEKARLVKEKKIRKPKVLPPLAEDKVPFEVPDGWAWTSLGREALVVMGNSPPGASYNDHGAGVPLINGPVEFSPKPLGLTVRSKFTTAPKQMCVEGDLIVCVRGATTGRTNLAGFDACVGRGVALVRGWVAQPYVNLFMRQVGSELLATGKGTTFPSISYSDLAGKPFPVPPLAEQKRIVARVDELMGLLDRLEAARDAREATRAALRDASLAALRDADTPEEVEVAWERIARRMDDLFTDPADVKPLRQTVLQLAVRGRLVPQDPEDEPASVLLERIAAEKARLVKEKKIRKPKALPPVSEDEVPFGVPDGWAWTRLAEVATSFQNGTSKRRGDGPPVVVLRLADIKRGQVTTASTREIGLSAADAAKYAVETGDVLAIRVNGSADLVGRFIPIRRSARWAYCDHLIRIRTPPSLLEPEYLCLFAGTSSARQHLEGATVTTAGQKTVNQTGLGTLPVPLPPLAEQKRIVAKVDELMGLLDRLAKHLAHKTEAHDAFAAAAVHHLDA